MSKQQAPAHDANLITPVKLRPAEHGDQQDHFLSPFSQYCNFSLSPIKASKTLHVQTYNDLNPKYTPPAPMFVSPEPVKRDKIHHHRLVSKKLALGDDKDAKGKTVAECSLTNCPANHNTASSSNQSLMATPATGVAQKSAAESCGKAAVHSAGLPPKPTPKRGQGGVRKPDAGVSTSSAAGDKDDNAKPSQDFEVTPANQPASNATKESPCTRDKRRRLVFSPSGQDGVEDVLSPTASGSQGRTRMLRFEVRGPAAPTSAEKKVSPESLQHTLQVFNGGAQSSAQHVPAKVAQNGPAITTPSATPNISSVPPSMKITTPSMEHEYRRCSLLSTLTSSDGERPSTSGRPAAPVVLGVRSSPRRLSANAQLKDVPCAAAKLQQPQDFTFDVPQPAQLKVHDGEGASKIGLQTFGVERQLSTGSARKSSNSKRSSGGRRKDGGCRSCNCKRSKCLKLYCECFAAGVYCEACACEDCFNTRDHEDEVQQARAHVLARDPFAFAARVGRDIEQQSPQDAQQKAQTPLTAHAGKKYCSCKRSQCRKKYCICFEAGVQCTDACKCEGCANRDCGDCATTERIATPKSKKKGLPTATSISMPSPGTPAFSVPTGRTRISQHNPQRPSAITTGIAVPNSNAAPDTPGKNLDELLAWANSATFSVPCFSPLKGETVSLQSPCKLERMWNDAVGSP
eukprot:jgi/Chlat1/1490/Chrsp12S02037